MTDNTDTGEYPSVDGTLRFGGGLLDPEFAHYCKWPTAEAFIRTLASVTGQLLSDLRSKGADWKFSYSQRRFRAQLTHVGKPSAIREDHYLLELHENTHGHECLVLSLVISIDLIEAGTEDARFMVGRGNSTNGIMIPLVKIIVKETTVAGERQTSIANVSKCPAFETFYVDFAMGEELQPYDVRQSSQNISELASSLESDVQIADNIVREIDGLRQQIESWDDEVDRKDIYFSVFGAFIDEAQHALVQELQKATRSQKNNKFDWSTDYSVSLREKGGGSSTSQSDAVRLKDKTNDPTPASGDTETSKTKSQQTDASVPDAGSALERTPSMIPAFEGALNRESFAKWFVELREGMGLNQRELAQVTGHSKSFIARIETGEAPLEKGFEVLGKLGICVGASFFPSQAPEPNTN